MRSALRALVALLAFGAACKGKAQIGLEITLPQSAVGDTEWFEVGAFRDTRCAAVLPMLNDGIPEGANLRVAFKRSDAETPRIGDIPRGAYAFAAVAKGEDCGVLATGCVEVELPDTESVVVQMSSTEEKSGACEIGASCQAARCVPANNNADIAVGANCSLELLGAGPLANPIGGGGTLVSAPAIAATPSGFVIVYREIDPNGATARVTVLPIDPAGGALDPARPQLKGRCANSDEFDGVGLAMNGEAGQIVLARSACGAKPGLELLSFTSKPQVEISKDFRSSDSPTAQALTLAGAHVAAQRAAGDVIVFTEDGANRIATVKPGVGVTDPAGSFGAQSGSTGAWVAASDKVLAVLSGGPLSTTPTPVDGGADAAPLEAGPPPEEEGPTLGLVMVPVTDAVSTFDASKNLPRAPIAFQGEWGAVAARGTRVIVLSDGGGPGRSASFRTFDLGKTAFELDGFSVEGAGKVTTGDVTMVNDRVYFAVLKPGSVSLHVFSNASTQPKPLREVLFAKQPRIAAIETVKDGRVAIAANETRVAVAWTTAKTLNPNDSTGGYAVFACTQ